MRDRREEAGDRRGRGEDRVEVAAPEHHRFAAAQVERDDPEREAQLPEPAGADRRADQDLEAAPMEERRAPEEQVHRDVAAPARQDATQEGGRTTAQLPRRTERQAETAERLRVLEGEDVRVADLRRGAGATTRP